MVLVHPIVIIMAILSGLYTAYLGWKRFQFKRGRAPVSAFPWQRHIRWGKRFYILLWIGFFVGLGYLLYVQGNVFATGLHAYLAILIIIFFSIGFYLGVRLSKGKGSDRIALIHMGIHYGTFLLVFVQIVLGVILLTFFLHSG
jgi:hypothetical protein